MHSARLSACTTPVSDGGRTSPRQAVCSRGADQPKRWRKTSQTGTVGAKSPQGEGLHSFTGPRRPGRGRCFQDGRPSAERSHRPEGKHAGWGSSGICIVLNCHIKTTIICLTNLIVKGFKNMFHLKITLIPIRCLCMETERLSKDEQMFLIWLLI